MNWWHYLLLANLYLALFYGFYLLLLRKETYFMLNRIYLVSAAILSFFIPLIQSEWVKNLFITQKVQQTIYYIDPSFVYQVSPKAESGFTISQFFTAVYWFMVMLLLARLIYRFILLKRFMQKEESRLAFSFFGMVRVDENLPQKETIEQHELVHVAQLHSADVLLFEVLAILNWFNPVIYFYRKAIKHIHEFIADRDAVSFGVNRSDYALLLLSQSLGVQLNTLTNNFFNQSLLKQRIMMLHKNPSKRSALLKYGLSAPLFVAMLILTSATVSEQKTIRQISDNFGSDIPVNSIVMNIDKEVSSPQKTTSAEKTMVKTVSTLNGKVVNVDGAPLVGVKISNAKRHIDVTTDQVAPTVKPDTDRIISFAAVEKLPSFPGGERAFSEYLSKAIRYPKEAKDAKTQGRVIVSFIVEQDGKLSHIKVLRDIGGGCGEEAIHVLSGSPDWNPGIQNGKPVRVAYTMPINFSLANGNNATTTYGKTTVIRKVKFMNKKDSVITGNALLDTTKTINAVKINGNTFSNKALVIIDGVEAKGVNPLETINPNDIESMNVLKDKYATDRYGDKGKNGIILITTKKGKKTTETAKP